MKKSKSSVPRFAERCELPPPEAKKEGLFATAGRAPPPALPAPAFVAIAVGKTNEGESLPANPRGCQLREFSAGDCPGKAEEDGFTKL
jgi:hypothetical protein